MTVDSSQTVGIITERTDLCAVVGRFHPVSDLFSPLSSSSSSGENVILRWNKERRGDLRDFRHLFSRARISLWPLTDTQKNRKIRRLKQANEPAALSRPPQQTYSQMLVWKRLRGSALDHFDGQPVSGLGPLPRTALLLGGLLKLTVSIDRERPRSDVFISHSHTRQRLQTRMWTND